MQDLVFYLHIGSLCVAAIGVFLADAAAFSWLRGKTERIGRGTLFLAHWIVTLGLAGLILSGLYLFWPMRQYLIGDPLFWTKMIFVSALVINSFFIEYLMHSARSTPFALLSSGRRRALIASGAVSAISWIGAGITALFLF